MRFNKIIFLLLFISFSAWSQDEVKGQAKWDRGEEVDQSVIKRELFHQAFVEMANNGFKLAGKNEELFWKELDKKVLPFVSIKKAELQKKYGVGTAKWTEDKRKELDGDIRHSELLEKRQFNGFSEAFKNLEIVSFSTKPTPRMEIKSKVDREALVKIYEEMIAVPLKGDWEKVYLEIDTEGVHALEQKNVFIQDLQKWLKANWEGSFKELVIVDSSLKDEIFEYMNIGAETTSRDPASFKKSLWLKLHFKEINGSTLSSAVLIYLPTHQILSNVEGPIEQISDEKRRTSVLLKKAHYLLTEIKKNLKVEAIDQQIDLVQVVDFKTVNELTQVIEEIKLKGEKLLTVVELRKIQDGVAEVLIRSRKVWPSLNLDLGLNNGKLSAGSIKKSGP